MTDTTDSTETDADDATDDDTGAPADAVDTAEPRARPWWRASLPEVGAGLAIFGVAAVLRPWAIALKRVPVGNELLAWDSEWYLLIAEHGYSRPLTQQADAQYAFFPLFPGLVKVVHLVTGLDYRPSALVAGNLCAAAAVVGVVLLFRRLTDRRTAVFAGILFATQPLSVVLSMGYTEGLFVALACAALLAVRRDDWLLAGAFAALAGLTRSTGIAVSLAVLVGAALAIRAGRYRGWPMLVGCAVACAGTPGYLLWVGRRNGELDAWSRIQEAGWGTRWDWGRSAWDFVLGALEHGEELVEVSSALLIILFVVGTVVALAERPWAPFAVYGLAVVALTVGQSNPYHSKLRLVLPALLLLLPVASALAKARRVPAYAALGVLALFGLWYGAYMLATWDYAI